MSKYLSNELLKAVLECKYDLETTTYTTSSSDLMIMNFTSYHKESSKVVTINVITDKPELQDRKKKQLHIGYILQLCDDWARFNNRIVINDLEGYRVCKRDTLEVLQTHRHKFIDKEYHTLSTFDIFKGYQLILDNKDELINVVP